jgi:hypothetical protein
VVLLNISTYKDCPCKTMEKLVAIMNRGSDVIRGGERCEG